MCKTKTSYKKSSSEASEWATQKVGRTVTPSNISYLIQYGRIRKFDIDGSTKILRTELDDYYNSYDHTRELKYKSQLGDDIN